MTNTLFDLYFDLLQFQHVSQQYLTTDNFNSRSALDPVIEYKTNKNFLSNSDKHIKLLMDDVEYPQTNLTN